MSLVAGIAHVSVRSAAADQIGFAVDNTENLFSVNLTTATATPIGFTGQFLQGLAFSPQGGLFGTDFLGNLFSVSTTTGAATFIGTPTFPGMATATALSTMPTAMRSMRSRSCQGRRPNPTAIRQNCKPARPTAAVPSQSPRA